MQNLYSENSANFPRLKTDKFFVDYENTYRFNGFVDEIIRFIEDFGLYNDTLWARFVNQYKNDGGADDRDGGWRGEYWGKMMRGACFTYSYTKNPKLYEALSKTVADMTECASEDGRISSYSRESEFRGWDIWSRKYVLLGMQYFLEICTDEAFAEKITTSMRGQLDYIISKIGRYEDGKLPINKASNNWRGLNSSSVLEPTVRLYTITKDKKYLDFAKYIIDCGGTEVENIFELAYKDKMYPYQYPITKAYEMISCFEGLLEYYRIVGDEKHKTAVINFANKILESDFTIIGCCGCTHELFDHSSVRQANTTNGTIMQETCVTVTLMKFFYQLTLITGDAKYSDAFEISMYNAYFGAVNTDRSVEMMVKKEHPDWNIEPLPFDSYSPLTAGIRGNGIGGLKVMSDNHYYGCCACIGSAGNGLAAKMSLLASENGLAVNMYFDGSADAKTPTGKRVTLKTSTAYPKDGNISISVDLDESENFDIILRNPEWSKNTEIYVKGEKLAINEGYVKISRAWSSGDKIEISLDMRTRTLRPTPYGCGIVMDETGLNYMTPRYDEEDPVAHKHIALMRGPIVLAQENRLGYCVDEPIEIITDSEGYAEVKIPEKDIAPYKHIVEVTVSIADGKKMHVTDYASAGKTWTAESKMAAWMLTK